MEQIVGREQGANAAGGHAAVKDPGIDLMTWEVSNLSCGVLSIGIQGLAIDWLRCVTVSSVAWC